MSATEWKFRIFFIIFLQSEIWLLSTCSPIKTIHFTTPTRFPDWFRHFTTTTPFVRPKLTVKPFSRTDSTLPYVDFNHGKVFDSATASIWVIYGIVFLICLLIFLLKNICCFMMYRNEREQLLSRTTMGPSANQNSLPTINEPHTIEAAFRNRSGINSGGVNNEAFLGAFPSYGVSSTADSLPTITVPHTNEAAFRNRSGINSGGANNEAFLGTFPSFGVSSTADKPPGYSDVVNSDSNREETKFPEVFTQLNDETPPPKYDEIILQRY